MAFSCLAPPPPPLDCLLPLSRPCCALSPPPSAPDSPLPVACRMVSGCGARPQDLIFFPSQAFPLPSFSPSCLLSLYLSHPPPSPSLSPLLPFRFNLQQGLSGTAAGLPHHFSLPPRGFAAVSSSGHLHRTSSLFCKTVWMINNSFI